MNNMCTMAILLFSLSIHNSYAFAAPGLPEGEWFGTYPTCGGEESDCTSRGLYFAFKSKSEQGDWGELNMCFSGHKVYCTNEKVWDAYVWLGTAPTCSATCSDCTSELGDDWQCAATDDKGDGDLCDTNYSTGKVLCVLPAKYSETKWVGSAPFCDSDCTDCTALGVDWECTGTTATDPPDGSSCWSGSKTLCGIPLPSTPAPTTPAPTASYMILYGINPNFVTKLNDDPNTDPLCAEGQRKGNKCFPDYCTVLGGSGCTTQVQSGWYCCDGHYGSSIPSCSVSNAPCYVDDIYVKLLDDDANTDPLCAEGQRKDNKCFPDYCTVLGGSGCTTQVQSGWYCCDGHYGSSIPSCSVSNAPCYIDEEHIAILDAGVCDDIFCDECNTDTRQLVTDSNPGICGSYSSKYINNNLESRLYSVVGTRNDKPYYAYLNDGGYAAIWFDGGKWLWGPLILPQLTTGGYWASTIDDKLDAADGAQWENKEIYFSRQICGHCAEEELLLEHKDVANGYFSSEMSETGIENLDNKYENTYSKIGDIDEDMILGYKDTNGYFTFHLKYITLGNAMFDIVWKQTSWLTEGTIEGYTPIDVPNESTNYRFGGLGRSQTHYAYLDGTGSEKYWWNAAGTETAYKGGIPCFNQNICKTVELFVYKAY